MVDSQRELELRHAIEDFFFGFRAFTARPDQLLDARGLARTHHRVLYFVRREPGITVGELLGVLGITKQAVHAPLKELQRQNLVVSERDQRDGRIRRLRVTPEGAEFEAELTRTQMTLLDNAFRQAGDDAEQSWRTVMAQLRSTL